MTAFGFKAAACMCASLAQVVIMAIATGFDTPQIWLARCSATRKLGFEKTAGKDRRLMAQQEPARSLERAVTLHQNGQLAEAERLYRAILESEPNHFECLVHLGALRTQQGQFAEAFNLLKRALAQNPESAVAYNQLGVLLMRLERLGEALNHFDHAIANDGAFVDAHYNRGIALQILQRYEAAINAFESALAADPDLTEARYKLGGVLRRLNRLQEAVAQYESALSVDPDDAEGHVTLGDALEALGRREDAIVHYEKALAIEPGSATRHDRLGVALQRVNRHADAIIHHREAIALSPDNADAHNNLGMALQALNRRNEAIALHEKALALRPGFAAAHNNLGLALQSLNLHDRAIEQYRKAIAIAPPSASRFGNLGMALQEMGRLGEAAQAFSSAIKLAPRTGRFYRNLADCRRFTAGDPEIAAMEGLAKEIDTLPEHDRRQLLFALGKAFADLGQYERSFTYWSEGNSRKRQQSGYDEARVLGEFNRIQSIFTRDLMDRFRGVGHPSAVPVFILGMPRSGTTLVEQVLASHSQVFGAGELANLGRAVLRLGNAAETMIVPEGTSWLSAERLRELGTRYVEGIISLAPAAVRITDKMPLNFFYVGLIHLALPQARIIHTRRDPVDTCFSCFATLFTGEHRVAYDLAELGRYYRAYEHLMDHWRSVLPSGVMLEVGYEDLVGDFEGQARRIVAHAGLDWEDACLKYYETRHPVRTASMAQVRQPIYRNSIGRSRHYWHLLGPLLEILTDATSDSIRDN